MNLNAMNGINVICNDEFSILMVLLDYAIFKYLNDSLQDRWDKFLIARYEMIENHLKTPKEFKEMENYFESNLEMMNFFIEKFEEVEELSNTGDKEFTKLMKDYLYNSIFCTKSKFKNDFLNPCLFTGN